MTLAIARTMRDTWESTATHQEIKAKHGLADYFVRRFRVEGSPIGNSRLLRRHDAVAAATTHGGDVVEVIPSTSAAVRHAMPMPACPVCEVEAGKPCKSGSKKMRPPHAKRWRAFHGVEDE